MFSKEDIDALRIELVACRKLVVFFPGIKGRLFIQHNCIWGDPGDAGMLIAFEGGGCLVYTPPNQLTLFSLVMAGFNLVIAGCVYKFLCQLFHFDSRALSYTKQKTKRKPKTKTYEPTTPTLPEYSTTAA